MSKLKWQRAAVGLVCLGAANWLAGQAGPKTNSPPAGPRLVFDAETKEYHASAVEANAVVTFYATNVWTNSIVIQGVYGSCHCTTATMPADPWVLTPGASGAVTARVDLQDDEEGTVVKTLTVFTSVGERVLTLEVSVAPALRPPGAPLTEAERKAALAKSAEDARTIFKGDCATCHADKGRGLLGKELYNAACGICHDSPRRASFVPDLRALKQPTDLDYWKNIIARGKPRTTMPGFATAEGGPLTETQVSSLAAYLNKAFPSHPPAR